MTDNFNYVIPVESGNSEYRSWTSLSSQASPLEDRRYAKLTLDAELQMAKVTYRTGNFTYTCISDIGTELTSANWQVRRLEDDAAGNTRLMWADGNDKFDNVATDLAAVAALTFE